MKIELLMRRSAAQAITPWSAEVGEVREGSALAEPKFPSTNAPKAGNIGETKPASRFAAWIHAPFIP